MLTERFIVEVICDGNLEPCAKVCTEQNLLNDRDLDFISKGKGKTDKLELINEVDSENIFVRRLFEPSFGYYKDNSTKWVYGARTEAINEINSRLWK